MWIQSFFWTTKGHISLPGPPTQSLDIVELSKDWKYSKQNQPNEEVAQHLYISRMIQDIFYLNIFYIMYQLKAYIVLRKLDTPGRISTKGDNFLTSCLVSPQSLFRKGIFSKRKQFAPMDAFRVDPFSDRRKYKLYRVA